MANVVRKVWRNNMVQELNQIEEYSKKFGVVSMDTVFPGTVFKTGLPLDSLSCEEHYSLMKKNVDALNIIQVGLTLSDYKDHYTWEFNFCDFDPDRDDHNGDSIALLRSQGIDLSKHKRDGIKSRDFARVLSRMCGSVGKTWVTFHGLYDLGYLIKILTGRALPHELSGFMAMVQFYFGTHVYDLKPVAELSGFGGGLDKVARNIGLQRRQGKSHQAGSDSLLTMEAYVRWVLNPPPSSHNNLFLYKYVLYGLTWLPVYNRPQLKLKRSC